MGFIKSVFEGPPEAVQTQIDRPVTVEQAAQAQQNTQTALAQQQAFLQAAQGQNGLGNQSQVFNALQGQVDGTGFNPAQAQLANSTGANVANQAALAAGQRGASQNAGLIARQAGMQGANIQQQAAGQGAALQAQQSQGALQQQGAIAGQQVGNQLAGNQMYGQTALGQQQNLLSGVNAQNQAALGASGQVNQANQSGYAADSAIFGGLLGAAGAAMGKGKAHGGEIEPEGAASGFGQHVAMRMKAGGVVPGTPKIMADNPKNDVVPAMLTPKEIVLPLSVTQAKDAPAKAAAFVAAILSKNKGLKR